MGAITPEGENHMGAKDSIPRRQLKLAVQEATPGQTPWKEELGLTRENTWKKVLAGFPT